jgi:hypothetical protein
MMGKLIIRFWGFLSLQRADEFQSKKNGFRGFQIAASVWLRSEQGWNMPISTGNKHLHI